jgi:hypothetical protein
MIKYPGIIVFLFVFIAFACKKPETSKGHSLDCESITNTVINEAELLRCKYKINSFWVYKDSVSGATDTARIQSVRSRFGFMPFLSGGCDSIEHYEMFYNTTDISDYKYYSSFILNLIPDRLYIEAMDSKGGTPVIYAPSKKQDMNYSFYDSISVLNKWYKKVYKSDTLLINTYSSQSKLGKLKIVYFYTVTNGIIRKDYYDWGNKLINKKYLQSANILL